MTLMTATQLFPRGTPYKEIRSHKDGAALAPSLPTAGPLRQSLGIVEMQLVVMAGDSEVDRAADATGEWDLPSSFVPTRLEGQKQILRHRTTTAPLYIL